MGDLNRARTWVDGETCTAAKLNAMQDDLTLKAGTVDTAELANGAVTSAKLDPSLALAPGRLALTNGRLIAGNASNVGVEVTPNSSQLEISGSTLQVKAGGIAATQLASGAVTTAKLADGNVTLAKLASLTDARLLGRSAGSAGVPQEITVGSGLALAAGVLSASGVGVGLRVAGYAVCDTVVTGGFTVWGDIPNLTLTVTPASASSKFLLLAVVCGAPSLSDVQCCLRLAKNGDALSVTAPDASDINLKTGGGSLFYPDGTYQGIPSVTLFHYDQPASASSVTYSVQARVNNTAAGATVYLNRGAYGDGSHAQDIRGVSRLFLLEFLS